MTHLNGVKIPAFKRHQKIFSYGGNIWGRNPFWPYILYIKYRVFSLPNLVSNGGKRFFTVSKWSSWFLFWMSLGFLKMEHTGNEVCTLPNKFENEKSKAKILL